MTIQVLRSEIMERGTPWSYCAFGISPVQPAQSSHNVLSQGVPARLQRGVITPRDPHTIRLRVYMYLARFENM